MLHPNMAAALSGDLPPRTFECLDETLPGENRETVAHAGTGNRRRISQRQRAAVFAQPFDVELQCLPGHWRWLPRVCRLGCAGREGRARTRGSRPLPGARRQARSRVADPCLQDRAGGDWRKRGNLDGLRSGGPGRTARREVWTACDPYANSLLKVSAGCVPHRTCIAR